MECPWRDDGAKQRSRPCRLLLFAPLCSRTNAAGSPGAAAHSSPAPGSVDDLELIIADLLPTGIPTDLMARRGKEAQRIWGELAGSPIYEALTIWVMAAFPEQALDRVDTMVRTAIAAGHQVREGRWSTRRLIGVVHKAGRRPEHREVHRHLGRSVSLVSYDAVELELADDRPNRSRFPLRWGGPSSPICVCPWVNTGTWSRRTRRHGWTATRTSPSIISTRSRRKASRLSAHKDFVGWRCSRRPGPRGGRTSRIGSPMSSATCRIRRSWPSPACCWARTTVRRPRSCGATSRGCRPWTCPATLWPTGEQTCPTSAPRCWPSPSVDAGAPRSLPQGGRPPPSLRVGGHQRHRGLPITPSPSDSQRFLGGQWVVPDPPEY